MAEKIVSCFIDEAGDFGNYDYHSPYYIVSVVIHDQSKSIRQDIEGLDHYLSSLGFSSHALHTAPLIRREYRPAQGIFMNRENRENKRFK